MSMLIFFGVTLWMTMALTMLTTISAIGMAASGNMLSPGWLTKNAEGGEAFGVVAGIAPIE